MSRNKSYVTSFGKLDLFESVFILEKIGRKNRKEKFEKVTFLFPSFSDRDRRIQDVRCSLRSQATIRVARKIGSPLTAVSLKWAVEWTLLNSTTEFFNNSILLLLKIIESFEFKNRNI